MIELLTSRPASVPLALGATTPSDRADEASRSAVARGPAEETLRDVHYPLSRWYLRPLAGWCAERLAATRVRPWHLTMAGLVVAMLAAGMLAWWPIAAMRAGLAIVGALVLVAWFCDRVDGQLARWQHTCTAWGAWLDGNVDELVDISLHVAVACAASRMVGASWPWALLGAFVAGKYLMLYSIATELPFFPAGDVGNGRRDDGGVLRWLYHLPANADVRVHLLTGALLLGAPVVELAFVAAYYNARWLARYVLVARRLGGAPR